MDAATLALIAFNIAKPFLEKTQEGIARKVGEDIWDLIKKPFVKKGDNQPEDLAKDKPAEFNCELTTALNNDPELFQSLAALVSEAQKSVRANNQQNITNLGQIEKQVNIQNVNGNLSL